MIAEPLQFSEASTQRKAFRRDGLGYVWDVSDYEVQLRADYLSAKTEEMHGEIAVTRLGRHLHLARFNLSSSASRKSLATTLESVTKDLGIPWAKVVEQFCVGVLKKEREGEPTRYTSQLTARRRLVYLVEPLVILGKTNMLFAPGGSGKGMTCVGLSCGVAAEVPLGDLSVMKANPFYFDWEEDFDTFEDRLNAVAMGFGIGVPKIPYRRMRGLASDHINEMARAISDEGANFGIIDSFSAAGGTVSDHTGWDTIAHRLFDALDQVPNMTWLIIDHVTGDKLKDPSGKAYGSVQKMNRVRNAWEMRSEQEPGSPEVHMRFFHAKWNHTGRKKPIGMCMKFSGETVTFGSEDPAESAGNDTALVSLATRMSVQLSAGPLPTAQLAKLLKTSDGTIRSEVSRNGERFRRYDDGLIHLRSSEIAEPAVEQDRESLPW